MPLSSPSSRRPLRLVPSSVPSGFLFLCYFLVQLSGSVHAETPTDVPNPLRTNRSWISDMASVIPPETELQINRLIEAEEHRSGNEITVVTIHSLGDLTVKEFANQLFNLWKIGKKEKNNGVLLLAAIEERKVRIEVGLGLESTLTNGAAGDIISRSMVPAFQRGDYGGGLLGGTQSIIAKLGGAIVGSVPSRSSSFAPSPSVSKSAFAASPPSGPSGGVFVLMALGGVGMAVVALGACVVVIVRDRKSKIPHCPQCHQVMKPLPTDQKSPYLNEVQEFENKLGARDWQVWSCPNCTNTLTLAKDIASGHFDACPKCHNRTARSSEYVITSATKDFEGLSDFDLQCQWPPCGHHEVVQRKTSRLLVVSSSSSSSSDNSFSSSSSDFGGGSSSGGGSDSSW